MLYVNYASKNRKPILQLSKDLAIFEDYGWLSLVYKDKQIAYSSRVERDKNSLTKWALKSVRSRIKAAQKEFARAEAAMAKAESELELLEICRSEQGWVF